MGMKLLQISDSQNVEVLLSEPVFPKNPLLILAHGSGNNMNSEFLEVITKKLHDFQLNVLRFNFPYMVKKRKIPDSQKTLEYAWFAAIEWAQQNVEYGKLYIGGKSLGARIASMIADRVEKLNGLVFLGYPLHPPGKFQNRRDAHLFQLTIPMLFVQGARDTFARKDLIIATVEQLISLATLKFIEQGDHSFRIPRAVSVNYKTVLETAADSVINWIKST
jgi:predicted alpha/beta-hydrolase family hydrolase